MKHILLKLVDGCDIIARVMQIEEDYIKVDNPLKIVYNIGSPLNPTSTALLHRYAYFCDQVVFEFKREHVVQALEPKEDFISWYENVLQHIENTKQEDTIEDIVSKEDDDENEYMETLLERFAIANNQLH